MNIREQIKTWLDSERGRWPAIAAEAGVTYDWLTKIMSGRIRDPGLDRMERLAAVMRRGKRKHKAA